MNFDIKTDDQVCINHTDDRCVNCTFYTRDNCLVDWPKLKVCRPVSPDDTCGKHESIKWE